MDRCGTNPFDLNKNAVAPKKRKYFFPQRDESQHFLKGQSPNMLEDVRPLTTIYQTWGASSSAKVSVLFKMADFENYHDSNSKQLFNINCTYIIYINSCPKTKCMVSYVYLPTNINLKSIGFNLPSIECLGRFLASPVSPGRSNNRQSQQNCSHLNGQPVPIWTEAEAS